MAASIAESLGKNVGPLPLGVWIAVGGVGLFVGYRVNKSMANKTAAQPSNQQLTESGVGTGGGQFVYDPPQNIDDTTVETNNTWGIKVTNWLVKQGNNALAADNAVRKYLSALPLSLNEKLMINLAILEFGVPPEPLPPVDDDDTTVPPINPVPIVVPKLAPKSVSSLHVNRATGRNEVVWADDNNEDPAVTHYVIRATNTQSGNSIVTTINEVPGINTYSWTHQASPTQGAQSIPYRYTVTPYNSLVPGPGSDVNAAMTLY